MDSLRNTYADEEEDDEEEAFAFPTTAPIAITAAAVASATSPPAAAAAPCPTEAAETASTAAAADAAAKEEPFGSDSKSEDGLSDDYEEPRSEKPQEIEEDDEGPPPKKQKPLSSLNPLVSPAGEGGGSLPAPPASAAAAASSKKSKKKSNNVWTKPTSRKGKKKSKPNNQSNGRADQAVLISPVPKIYPDKNDDCAGMKICLSKVYKAERVELSEDRMSAGSTKGYRMVRATRGVVEGAWYFEIRVVKFGETGHTRLGWSMEKGDLQAPVGYDANSYGYRDIDGCKIHKALREKYGEEGYVEGDVIGFYINLPEGSLYAPRSADLVWYKGQRYVYPPEAKEDPPKIVPGSQISFYKNGVFQGVAFKDLHGGRYYPAASLYTLPNQPNCTVKFNFGPDFEFFPQDFDGWPVPRPMIEVPYDGFDNTIENGVSSEN